MLWATVFIGYDTLKSLISSNSSSVKSRINNKVSKDRRNDTTSKDRQLTLMDMELGEYMGKGAYNLVFEVFLPDWWREQRGDDDGDAKKQAKSGKERFVLKVASHSEMAERDIFILETLNSDAVAARGKRIMPLYYAGRNITNPFYWGLDLSSRRILPNSTQDSRALLRLLTSERIWAHIVPLYDHGTDDCGNIKDICENDLGSTQKFMKSYLEMLDYAHSLGINNNDLSRANVCLDRSEGLPMITDWNGYLPKGGRQYVANANPSVTAPEGLLRTYNGHNLTVTTVGALDVWAVGYYSFADALVCPTGCSLVNKRTHHDRRDFLKEVILAIGGSTMVPVDANSETDLAVEVGLDGVDIAKRPFTLPVVEGLSCSKETFKILEDQSDEVRRIVMDLLQHMLRIDPRKRKTCKELLQHPFFNLVF